MAVEKDENEVDVTVKSLVDWQDRLKAEQLVERLVVRKALLMVKYLVVVMEYNLVVQMEYNLVQQRVDKLESYLVERKVDQWGIFLVGQKADYWVVEMV